MIQLAVSGRSPPARWLQRRDPRLRVIAALLLALVALSIQQLSALLILLLTALTGALAVGLSARLLARRLLVLEGLMVVLLLLLPFSVPGEIALSLGPFDASWEGVQRALQIFARANTVVLGLIVLTGTLEPEVLGHALASLRVPPKIVHLFLFTSRYISVLSDEYLRLRLAMRARAFVAGSNRHTWRSLGWLFGMLLVRSMERSERILAAMKCRGFSGRFYLYHSYNWKAGDSWTLLIASLLSAAAVSLEYWHW